MQIRSPLGSRLLAAYGGLFGGIAPLTLIALLASGSGKPGVEDLYASPTRALHFGNQNTNLTGRDS